VLTVRAYRILVAGCPLAAAARDAPATDTTPFHARQWAAQFSGGVNLATLGALRFTAPTRAWLVDFSFTGGHAHATDRLSDTSVVQSFTSQANGALRLGRRFYQGRGRSVVSFQTLGVLGGFVHNCQGSQGSQGSPSFLGNSCNNGWTAGGFGELGAAYLITPRFSIGGAATVSFDYERTTGSASGGARFTRWSYQGTLRGPSFQATVYF
jgi:hypothetical protein